MTCVHSAIKTHHLSSHLPANPSNAFNTQVVFQSVTYETLITHADILLAWLQQNLDCQLCCHRNLQPLTLQRRDCEAVFILSSCLSVSPTQPMKHVAQTCFLASDTDFSHFLSLFCVTDTVIICIPLFSFAGVYALCKDCLLLYHFVLAIKFTALWGESLLRQRSCESS